MKSLTAQSGLLAKKWDIIESTSSFHRETLAQGDKGNDPGQQKMRPVILPTLPAAWHPRRQAR